MPRSIKQTSGDNGAGDGDNSDLERFVERVQDLEAERRSISHDINDVLTEAADAGHNKKAVRAIVKLRLETMEQKAQRVALEDAIDDMKARLGMLADTPLGGAAVVQFSPTQQ
jgi:uncharacterized protein (UPF0335 family)